MVNVDVYNPLDTIKFTLYDVVPGVKKDLTSKIAIGDVHIPVEDLLHKYSTPKNYAIQAKFKVTG